MRWRGCMSRKGKRVTDGIKGPSNFERALCVATVLHGQRWGQLLCLSSKIGREGVFSRERGRRSTKWYPGGRGREDVWKDEIWIKP